MEDWTDHGFELLAIAQKEAPAGGQLVHSEEFWLGDHVVQVGGPPLG